MSTVDEEARQLAEKHYEIEVGVQQIIRLNQDVGVQVQRADRDVEKIGLLEVNANTVPAGVVPIEFAPVPASGVNYPAMILEVTPEEFEKIKTNELQLPAGWTIGELIPRPSGNGR
jgi:hypothetical protein